MNTSITIPNVPDAIREALEARAARSGQSLQEYLRGELIALAGRPSLAERPDNEELWDRIRERKRRSGVTLTTEEILELRDAARRDA